MPPNWYNKESSFFLLQQIEQKSKNNFVRFMVQMRKRKSASENKSKNILEIM